jgi:hypothetical protein
VKATNRGRKRAVAGTTASMSPAMASAAAS